MPTDHDLEQILRKAPVPPVPSNLEQRLIRQTRLARNPEPRAWAWQSIFEKRSWAPALVLFTIMAGFLSVLAMQQKTLDQLKETRQELVAHQEEISEQTRERSQNLHLEYQELQKQAAELAALRAGMREIEETLARLPQLTALNLALRSELSQLAKNNPELSPEYQAALEEARKKAERIRCVNNLKNIALAARIWATDSGGENLPPDFVSIRRELSTPKLLICPGDSARAGQQIQGWEQFESIGSSYEMISPGSSETTPRAVYARCPIHNNVALVDGSVQQLRPDQQLVQRNGYWEMGE